MSYEHLNELLDVDPTATANTQLTSVQKPIDGELVPAETVVATTDVALNKDFDFARDTIREAIQRASLAAIDAVALAQSGDSPRAYEVVGNMLTAIVNANKELVELHRSREETRKVQQIVATGGTGKNSSEQNVHIDKAVFVGRAADLLREIRALQKTNQ